MSNIYIQEPPTLGKVLLVTTFGDIDIELWAREAPKACRNFIQLGMEGYYNGTIFHRIVKGFIAQGGDPTGTGTGGESIYGEPFKDEFHTRLRFCRRGLVAMANAGKDDNGSQFFFTFAACPELQNKHTIFGKVAGETIYNVLKLEEAETNPDETPVYPHKILKVEILNNPFPDIVPRCLPEKKEKKKKTDKEKKTGVKNFKLLSFGEEAEEDEEESKEISLSLAGKSKSTHDALNDPKLSSVPALKADKTVDDLSGDEDCEKSPERDKLRIEDVRKKLKRGRSKSKEKVLKQPESRFERDEEEEYDFRREETEKKKQRLQEIAKEIEALKKDYHKNKKKEEKEQEDKKESSKDTTIKEEDNEMVVEYKQNLEKYKNLKNNMPRKGTSRESMTLELLEGFKKRLQAIKEKAVEEEPEEGAENKESNDNVEDNESWLAHKLNFEVEGPVLAKDANMKTDDWFDITDPRNPINKRRREQSKAIQKKF